MYRILELKQVTGTQARHMGTSHRHTRMGTGWEVTEACALVLAGSASARHHLSILGFGLYALKVTE